MNSAASIKPQAGVQEELRIQDHRTVGEASRERGHVPEERGGTGLLKKEHLKTILC